MELLNLNEKINIIPLSFHSFDGGLFLYDKDYLITEESDNYKIIESTFDFNFDGSLIYVNDIDKGEKFIDHINKHLERHLKKLKETSKTSDFEDDGFSNAFFYKKLHTGVLILDAKLDFGSILNEILEDFEHKESVEYYEDSHLANNMYLGRIDKNYDKFYKFLFDEKVIKAPFIFKNPIEFKSHTNIIVTGQFDFDVSTILSIIEMDDILVNADLKPIPENESDWIWCGNNPDAKIMELAQEQNCKISDINDVVNVLYSNFNFDRICVSISNL
jgi:hypothetical protein